MKSAGPRPDFHSKSMVLADELFFGFCDPTAKRRHDALYGLIDLARGELAGVRKGKHVHLDLLHA